MNEAMVTMTGNVATDVRHVVTDAGVHITSFRLGSTPRRWERGKGWVDQATSYVTVTCWRFLAQNAAASLHKGEPVVVTGTLRVREWSNDERSGVTTEIDASTIGHDLSRGVASFRRVTRTQPVAPEEDEALREPAGGATGSAPNGVDVTTGEVYSAARTGAEEDAA